jgi:hypothetical protein
MITLVIENNDGNKQNNYPPRKYLSISFDPSDMYVKGNIHTTGSNLCGWECRKREGKKQTTKGSMED